MSGIDYSKLRSLTAREIINALIKHGFVLERKSASGHHHQYYNPDGRRVTVSYHKPSDTFPPKTLKSMIEIQAKWKIEDLKRLKLI